MNIELDAKEDPNCDPSQGPCEEWLPGLYPVQIGKHKLFTKFLMLKLIMF